VENSCIYYLFLYESVYDHEFVIMRRRLAMITPANRKSRCSWPIVGQVAPVVRISYCSLFSFVSY